MKSILPFVIFIFFIVNLHAQKPDTTSQFLIGLDVTGALGIKINPGIRFQYEKSHIQLRTQLEYIYSESNTPTDTIIYTSKSHIFTPTMGAAWIASHDKFSFYVGNDFYYLFRRDKNNFPKKPNTSNLKSKTYGFEPLVGFRFPLHNRIFMAIEGKSDGRFYSLKDLDKNTASTSFNFYLLNSYGILLYYKI